MRANELSEKRLSWARHIAKEHWAWCVPTEQGLGWGQVGVWGGRAGHPADGHSTLFS